jgi:hypothetical protein
MLGFELADRSEINRFTHSEYLIMLAGVALLCTCNFVRALFIPPDHSTHI